MGEYPGDTNYRNSCSRQVRRATSYQDLPSMGQDGYQGRVSGPYNVANPENYLHSKAVLFRTGNTVEHRYLHRERLMKKKEAEDLVSGINFSYVTPYSRDRPIED